MLEVFEDEWSKSIWIQEAWSKCLFMVLHNRTFWSIPCHIALVGSWNCTNKCVLDIQLGCERQEMHTKYEWGDLQKVVTLWSKSGLKNNNIKMALMSVSCIVKRCMQLVKVMPSDDLSLQYCWTFNFVQTKVKG